LGCHAVTSSAAVTILLLVAGVGVKRRADRRGNTVHVAASVLCELWELPPWPKIRFWSSSKHTHKVGLLYSTDQQVTQAATYTTRNKTKGRTSVTSAGFESSISEIK